MKIIGVVGSRRRSTTLDYRAVEEAVLANYEVGDQLVSGGCPQGADHFAEVIARKHQIPITIHYARWNALGRRAGFARNTDIAEDADVLIACVADDRTGGTEDTIKKYERLKGGQAKLVLLTAQIALKL